MYNRRIAFGGPEGPSAYIPFLHLFAKMVPCPQDMPGRSLLYLTGLLRTPGLLVGIGIR